MKINYITHTEPSWSHPDIVVQDNLAKVIEMFRNTDFIGGDTENNGLNTIYATALLSQFSDSVESYVIDKTSIDCSFLKEFQDKQLLTANGQYDYMIWKYQYGYEFPNLKDIMIIEQILGRGSLRSNSLENIHNRRLNRYMPIPKTTREGFGKMKENPNFDVEHILYSGYDPHCLFEIYEKQVPLIKEYKLEKRIYDIAFPLISLLGDMCLEGFYLDKDKWGQVLRDNKTNKFHVECKLDEEIRKFSADHIELKGGIWTRKRKLADGEQVGLFNDSITIQNENKFNVSYGSQKQLTKLFTVLREPIPQKKDKKTQEYKNSFAEEALEQYKIEYPSSRMKNFINTLIEYREYEKEINSFGEIFIKDRVRDGKGKKFKRGYHNTVTQRVHTIYKQEFTANGRLSSGDSKRKKGSPGIGFYNSQQIPKKNKFRNCFTLTPQEIADGWLISTYDLSGAELVILASQSQDKKLIELLDGDVHSYLATSAYTKIVQYVLDNMTENRAYDELYNLFKVNRLQEMIHKTPEECEQITKQRVEYSLQTKKFIVDKKSTPDIREPFKNCTYGICYGAGENKIAETLNIAPYYASLTMSGMEAAIPDAFAYLERVARFGVKNGYIVFNTRTNSRHWFATWLDAKQYGRELSNKDRSAIERFCKNSVMSGTQADMLKEGMVEANKYIKANNIVDFKWKLQVHDEVVFKHKDRELAPKIAQVIIDTCNLYLEPNVRMKIAGSTGLFWNKE